MQRYRWCSRHLTPHLPAGAWQGACRLCRCPVPGLCLLLPLHHLLCVLLPAGQLLATVLTIISLTYLRCSYVMAADGSVHAQGSQLRRGLQQMSFLQSATEVAEASAPLHLSFVAYALALL